MEVSKKWPGVGAETVAEPGVEAEVEVIAGHVAEAVAVILLSIEPRRRPSSVACIECDKVVVC